MTSRTHIYCNRLERHFNKRTTEDKLLYCERRQRSTEEFIRRRTSSTKMLARRASSLQNINAHCREPHKRTGKTRGALGDTSTRGNELWKIVTTNNGEYLKSAPDSLSASTDVIVRPASSEKIPASTVKDSPRDDCCSTVLDVFHQVDNTDSAINSQEQFREKKVTFALDAPKKRGGLTAQMRRQNFRNSYSKSTRNKFTIQNASGSPVDASNENSEDCTAPLRIPNSGTSEENEDTEILPTAEVPAKQINNVDGILDRQKLQTVKRKLKSCRSRSFHKSLDSSLVHENALSIFSYKKPLKAIHPEVITMISLEDSEEIEHSISAKGESITASNAGLLTEMNAADGHDRNGEEIRQEPVLTKSDTPSNLSTGIMKFAGPNTKNIEFIHLSNQDQGRNAFASSRNFKASSFDEISKGSSNTQKNTISQARVRNTQSFESETPDSKIARPTVVNQSFEKCVPLQSVKEKECCSSFHRMTKKGFLISFDTILRGLLTPTEYRLRKNNLSCITQD